MAGHGEFSVLGSQFDEARRPRPTGSLWLSVCLRLSALHFGSLRSAAGRGWRREGEVVGLSLYLQFFWDFVTGNRRKSLGIGVFFGGEGGFGPGEAEGTIREKLCRWCLRRLGGVPMVDGYEAEQR